MPAQIIPATTTAREAAEAEAHRTVIGGRPLGEYRTIREHPSHAHHLSQLVGYVVRETIGPDREGALWRDETGERIPDHGTPARCGYDVIVVHGGTNYSRAIEGFHAYRDAGRYAVADHLYSCGCRS